MRPALALVALLASACGTPPQQSTSPPTVAQSAAPFPYPGMYAGTNAGGLFVYRMNADGNGLSCLRFVNGRTAFGDARYDGSHLYTDDATFDVLSLTDHDMRLLYAGTAFSLQRVVEMPSACKDFFSR